MIYIVEDDRNIQEIEIFALKNSGYQAVGFETAKEFYGALSEKLPELILLDIMLPDEDGLSILKRLRTRADTQKIPVILVTAKSTEIDKVKGLDGGADDYIAKPFGVMEMIARVKALLRRSGGAEESLMTCGNVTLDSEKRMVYVDGKPIELGFVLTDISTNFERVSDHCSNIAVYQIQVPKDEYDAHEYLQNVKHQEHAEFDREEMAYEKQYRLPDVARVQTAKAGE